jgi:hypothetical protein
MNRSALDHALAHGGDEIYAQGAPQRAIAQRFSALTHSCHSLTQPTTDLFRPINSSILPLKASNADSSFSTFAGAISGVRQEA